MNNLDFQKRISLGLMSARDHQAASFHFPYRYEIRTRRGMLHYFGSRHFFSPEYHLFTRLCELVEQIRPDLVVVEHLHELHRNAAPETRTGFLNSIAKMSEVEAVEKHCESGLAANLAIKIGAEVECPEPTNRERFEFLAARGYSEVQIASYYIARAMSMYPLWKAKYSPEGLVEYRINNLKKDWPWDPAILSAETANAYLTRYMGLSLFDTNSEELAAIVHPAKIETDFEFSALNALGAAESNFTDMRIVQRLCELCELYSSILVVFGASHALRQESILKELLPGSA